MSKPNRRVSARWLQELEAKIELLASATDRTEAQGRRHEELIAALERGFHRVESFTKSRYDDVMEGLGGAIWRTQAGHARFLAVLSTQHLENIIKWPSSSSDMKAKCRAELNRRAIDRSFREQERSTPGRSTLLAQPDRKPWTRDAVEDFKVQCDVSSADFSRALGEIEREVRRMREPVVERRVAIEQAASAIRLWGKALLRGDPVSITATPGWGFGLLKPTLRGRLDLAIARLFGYKLSDRELVSIFSRGASDR